MGEAEVVLFKQDNSYVIFHTISESNGSMNTYFLYNNSSESEALTRAREFGEARAKDLGVLLKENLNQDA